MNTRLTLWLFPVFLALAIIVASGASGAAAESAPTPSGPAVLSAPSGWRFGVAVNSPPNMDCCNVEGLGVGWFWNYGFNRPPGTYGNLEYVLRVFKSNPSGAGDPDFAAHTAQIKSFLDGDANRYPSGSTWLVGNEVGHYASDQSAVTAANYAHIYKQWYDWLKAEAARRGRVWYVGSAAVLPQLGQPYNSGASSGTDWLQKVRVAYRNAYGGHMPIDVYTIHLYGPPGSEQGYIIEQGINVMRQSMLAWGDQDKPLWITEFGLDALGSRTMSQAQTYMQKILDYTTQTATDIGQPSDGYRLVQRWAWFSLTPYGPYSGFDPLFSAQGVRTTLGDYYTAYPKDDRPPLPTPTATYTKTPVAPTATPTATRTRTVLPTITATATRTATAPSAPTATATATPTTVDTGGPYLVQVNCGGQRYVDSNGEVWAADRQYYPGTPGAWGYIGGYTRHVSVQIPNSTDDTLYWSDRYWGATAVPGYRFSVPNGAYEVTLTFAETYWNAAGKRRFHVRIEGVRVLTSYDIFADAGGKNLPAPAKVFYTTVSDGELALDFVKLTGYDTPKINAIRVRAAGGGPPPGDITATPTATVTATATRPAGSSGYVQRVNAGGGDYADAGGNLWQADQTFVSDWGYSGTATGAYSVSGDIAGATDDPLYRTERYGMTAYRFTVPNGTYDVTLKFSENYFSSAGKRVFNVLLEGATVLGNFDIYAAAGNRYTAVDRTFSVSVSDGILNLRFDALTDKPKVSAIEVVQR